MAVVCMVFFIVMCCQEISLAKELQINQALVILHNTLSKHNVSVLYLSDYCYKCLYQLLIRAAVQQGDHPTNASATVSVLFPLTLQIVVGQEHNYSAICSRHDSFGEFGHYSIWVHSASGNESVHDLSCRYTTDRAPVNSYLPIAVAFAIMIGLTFIYATGCYLRRLKCTQRYALQLLGTFAHSTSVELSPVPSADDSAQPKRPKSRRLRSLDTFRGLALTAMIFVNYGGGGYWFFEHGPWNGLTVADLVMPWFVFMIGTSVALSFNSMLRRGIHRLQLLRKLTWRTIILLLIGVFYINYGPADGHFSWERVRIPGVLQRLGFTYFVIAVMETCCAKKELKQYLDSFWAPVRDILIYWPEWIFIILLETLWLCLTFLLPVPGCPRGYLGAGGIGDDGKFPNCTGGAAGYIDKWLLGANHIYGYPTCKELYHTTEPFDPEGVLGTINSVLMAFIGLQAGKIILAYRPSNLSILKRFLIWAVLLGFISAVLTKCGREEGFIPVNKNLWSLSFITTTGCFSFILLGLMYYVIDVKEWWGGEPFIFLGMNSIFVYVGHSVLGWYFPFSWQMKHENTHAERLLQDLVGTAIWVLIAYMLYRKKFFLKI
ncbi:heparan-alpha-glucosaminide N-acetyltransferase isoform X1 [Scyliorhinus canicula]|uniref:heparan-alpha-glucosaminide N-acetyltransferase isoform X1 n=1 Tax=Scyliorhinus canicula TaxID=7830 RepID=UPI0018F63F38|nr:heparan-alpha-glucosaminide N-acetyltransferase isoform X1 [Scyliorhinus canicula]